MQLEKDVMPNFRPAFDRVRTIRCAALALLASAGLLTSPGMAWAKPTFPPIFIAVYHPVPGGTVAAAAQACTLCHAPSGPPNLNPYGRTVRNALKEANASVINASILHSIDNIDSDGDGFTNGQEIGADTLPGDPTSFPGDAGKPKLASGSHADGLSSFLGLFTLRTTLLSPRAQHPLLVHFPIALFVFSLLLDVLALVRRSPQLHIGAAFNLMAAAVMSVPACIAGILAWRIAFGGAALAGTLLFHTVFGAGSFVMLWSLFFVRRKLFATPDAAPPRTYYILAFVALGVLALTGFLGGTLSGTT
ncbi:MAG: hypothetical protein KGJ62_05350 [Armatimonadetes bacterium]|nr:hypothetical protein [Armatimonadota bacterium]MDE2208063.1 hypothetical protein [Armatimonadota bacterium]